MRKDVGHSGSSAATSGTGKRRWRGLADLTPALRREMAGILMPVIADHLERCLRDVVHDWMLGHIRGDEKIDPKEWADRLNTHRAAIGREFTQAIDRDFTNAAYPPEYDFSGISFATGDSELTILDDYQSTRRSLRHQLEARLRSHRYLHFMITRAALDDHRFEHPNWAPWSPLHWFERLLEAVERHFGRSPQSLALASAYVKHLTRNEGTLLTTVVETIDGLGLVKESTQIGEPEVASHNRKSWESVVRSQPALDGTDAGPTPPHHSDTPVSRETNIELPDAQASFGQWAQWMENLSGRFRGRSAGQGHDSAPATEELHRSLDSDKIHAPGDLPRTALTVPVEQLLEEGIERITREASFDHRVRAILARLPKATALAVIQDLEFFRQASHPLRVWLGHLINTGLRITPGSDSAQGTIGQVLECMEQFTTRLEQSADTLDRKDGQQLLQDWQTAIEKIAHLHTQQVEAVIAAFRRIEHSAAAWRALTLSVVRTGANLPTESAQLIADAWRELKSLDDKGGTDLHENVKSVVQAICLRATPAAVNPMVHELLRSGAEHGLAPERLQAIVSRLGRAHIQAIRAPSDAPRFNAQDHLRKHRAMRFENDAPELRQDLDDDFVFRAAQLRVGDWFEFVDGATAEPCRMALVWRGTTTRCFLFVGLDGISQRSHSLRGVAEELRTDQLRALPEDNPLDALLP